MITAPPRKRDPSTWETEDSSASSRGVVKQRKVQESKSKQSKVKQVHKKFSVGDELECEWFEPHYVDTIHPVRIVSVLNGGKKYRCKMHAFVSDEPHDLASWSALHQHRGAEPNSNYEVGDRIHFRYFNRIVEGKYVDGYVGSQEGCWVKGNVVELKASHCKIRHVDWCGGMMNSWVSRRHMRSDYIAE